MKKPDANNDVNLFTQITKWVKLNPINFAMMCGVGAVAVGIIVYASILPAKKTSTTTNSSNSNLNTSTLNSNTSTTSTSTSISSNTNTSTSTSTSISNTSTSTSSNTSTGTISLHAPMVTLNSANENSSTFTISNTNNTNSSNSFIVQISKDGVNYNSPSIITFNGLIFTISSQQSLTNYYVKVQEIVYGINSPWSNVVNYSTSPPPPQNITLIKNSTVYQPGGNYHKTSISFPSVTGAAYYLINAIPQNDPLNPVKSYITTGASGTITSPVFPLNADTIYSITVQSSADANQYSSQSTSAQTTVNGVIVNTVRTLVTPVWVAPLTDSSLTNLKTWGKGTVSSFVLTSADATGTSSSGPVSSLVNDISTISRGTVLKMVSSTSSGVSGNPMGLILTLSDTYQVPTAFSKSIWFNPDASVISGSVGAYFEPMTNPNKDTGSGTGNGAIQFTVNIASANVAYAIAEVDTDNSTPTPKTSLGTYQTSLVAGTWYHMVITCDGTTVKTYINVAGVAPSSNNPTTLSYAVNNGTASNATSMQLSPNYPGITNVNSATRIGSAQTGYAWCGLLSYAGMWDVALTGDQVNALFTNQSTV